MCIYKWLLFATILYLLSLISSVHAAGSCLANGITVCCRANHCPAQISKDGCYCDDTCRQFGDCCDDIDELCGQEELCTDGSLRLADGANDLQGRVEVCFDGVWGTVCHHNWSNTDARVVCAELGHPFSGAKGLRNAHFQQGTGPIHMDDVKCFGNETTLFDCLFNNVTEQCNHGMDVSVICSKPECNDSQIRLVGGPRASEGRVEVCLGGAWGTVCDDSWDVNDAKVVCNQLGLSSRRVLAFTGAYFGLGKGPINMDDVDCRGFEGSLTDCQYHENSDCTHAEDAGVICGVKRGCIDGSVRLAGGPNDSEGRVEICHQGAWTTVCDNGWDDYAAKVICREIGFVYAGAVSLGGGRFPNGSEDRQVYFTNVTCTGHESSILGCSYDAPSSCDHKRDATVRCLPGPAECTDQEVRLVGGLDEGQGRVEVCLFERWGTVCDHRWSTQHAEVVCRQLGLQEIGATALSGSYFGAGTGPINMDDVDCVGTEANLTQCTFTSNDNCDHRNDAGVRCPCIEGDIRLAGTTSPSSGRVEVCVGGVWGTVTDDAWGSQDSRVACRQLGFWDNVTYPVLSAGFGRGSGPIHLDTMSCLGTEERLLDCRYDPNTSEDSHAEDAGVICFDGTYRGRCLDGSVRLVNGSTHLEGRVEVCINGEWGSVCHYGWGTQDAAVVCSQLGYPKVGTPYFGGTYPPGSGPVYLWFVGCGSTHSSLLECPFSIPFSFLCPHFNDAGVKCYESSGCNHGEARLTGNTTLNEGRVEVCYDGVWGTVTTVGFDEQEARIVCKQLGFFRYLALPRISTYTSPADRPVVLSNLRCSGNENSLVDCSSSAVPVTFPQTRVAGVYCYTKYDPLDGPGSVPACSLGDIRLMDGDEKSEGRVEVCVNGEWGSVCGTNVNAEEANVICRQLGYASFGSIAYPDSYYPLLNDSQPMFINQLSCVGHEYQVWDCSVSAASSLCTGGSEASVKCQERECEDGAVRLADANSTLEGRVEVCLNGTWGTVCDDFWSVQDAIVICRQLGFSDEFALSYNSAFFGGNTNLPILIDNLQCRGNESNITQCVFETHTADCSHLEDAGIKCYPIDAFMGSGDECMQGDLRLVNGSSPFEGRVELCIDGQWGTVCDDRFNIVDGVVVCRQLGYSDLGATVIPGAGFGAGVGMPIYVDNALCFGEEKKLLDCLYDPHTADCSHNKDVGVKCVPKGQCTDGEARLVNGSRPTEGRVEICEGSVWGTVASVVTAFDGAAARVVCRQLGYSDEYAIPMAQLFGEGEGPVHGYNLVCQGDENNLLNCSHLKVPLNVINPHVADAGVRCFNLTDTPCIPGEARLVNGSVNTSTTLDGRLEVCLDGEWGTLCGDYWIEVDSRVVCNQLGYSKYAALTLPPGHYGLGNVSTNEVPVHFVPICDGTENSIMECSLVVVNSCTHSSDAAIRCYKSEYCTEGQTRLINNGLVGDEGRLEVCQHGIWGTVCEDLFTRTDARVVCRDLGFPEEYVSTFTGAYYGEGTGPIHLDNVECIGTENSLLDCPYDDGTDDCTHQQDVGVACYNQSQCVHGTVRLVGGNYSYEGRVEYCLNGIWGTVCDDFWDYYDAITVCLQLNLNADYAVGYTDAFYGEGQSEIVLDNVDCVRRETSLNQCFRLTTHNCIHAQDASVACYPTRQCPNEGDVRLLDGTTELEGRVEVCLNGVWGSIAGNSWNENAAIVVCRKLGYDDTDAVPFGFAQFGQTNGRINMNRLQCSGTESSLLECSYSTFTIFESHGRDAGVRCHEKTNCSSGDVRLRGGASQMEGRVEVCIDGIWGTINNRGWTNQEAKLICSLFGFSNKVAFTSTFGGGFGPILLTDVDCSGEEESILNCTYSTLTDGLSHFQDAGVKCFNETDKNDTCGNGEVRLIGGKTEYEGTVEICLGGQWGSICHFGWDVNDANVLCNQLGYSSTGNSALYAAFFGQSSGPIFLDNVRCVGSEPSLSDCPVEASPRTFCTHFQDAAVRCLPKVCEEGEIRLLDGSLSSEGRIELCMGGTWGTVCDSAWDTPDARVVCRQLGYSDEVGTAYTHSVFGHGTGPIHLANAQCTGNELNLTRCQYSTIVTRCSHGNDAGVRCYNSSGPSDVCSLGDIRLTGGGSGLMGSVEVCLDNEWGTVCDDQWDGADSDVACAQLGYPRVSTTYREGFFTSNAKAIHLDDVECLGTESSLLHCGYDYRTIDCSHAKDAGVQCYQSDNCTEGNIRLVGGPTHHEGRVEICYKGVWGTIQGSITLGELEAVVICRQLGFNHSGAAIGTGSYGMATGPVALANLRCRGPEAQVSTCSFSTRTAYLEHKQDIGVKCTPPLPDCFDGDLRLRDGPVPHWGRVEVCFNETWGTVTSDFWSFNDGSVACRQLGYSSLIVTIRYDGYFGQGTGPIYLDRLRCFGTERRLVDCLYSTDVSDDTHFEDAGVECALTGQCTHGQLRLVNGTVPSEGRVEVCVNGTWGTVNGDYWPANAARVVCRQLGYSTRYTVPVPNAQFGEGTDLPIAISSIFCIGSEEYLVNCTYSTFNFFDTHDEDAGVECYKEKEGNCTLGEVRIVNGTTKYEGRVEVCVGGEWGTVCDQLWSFYDAVVTCRQLGFSDTGAESLAGGTFGSGDGKIVFRNLRCSGDEADILECFHNSNIGTCTHEDDAAVRCLPGDDCIDGSVRLVDSGNSYEGRVEVCLGGVWGTVCHDFWSQNDAVVVCNQLGLPNTYVVPFREAYFGPGNLPIIMDNVACVGTESNLTECSFDRDTSDCTHRHDVGVACLSAAECLDGEMRLVNGASDNSSGRVEVCVNGIWGTVCHNYWSMNDAKVVCSALNLPSQYVIPYYSAFFGRGSGPVLLELVQCVGTERNLTACSHDTEVTCSHAQDAGVACLSERQCEVDGTIQLVNGTVESEGRLEVCLSGVWGTVTDDLFDDYTAAVLCNILGYPIGGEAVYGAIFGQGVGPIHLDNVFCYGSESSIFQCDHSKDASLDFHFEDVGLRCFAGGNCRHGDVRLSGGTADSEGNIEVCVSGIWGSVYSRGSLQIQAAKVVCRQLGYSDKGALVYPTAFFSPGALPYVMSGPECDGSESNLTECDYSAFPPFTSQFFIFGVKCFNESDNDNCSLGSTRLVGGNTTTEGRMEVCVDGQWGTFCAYSTIQDVGDAICGTVGFASQGAIVSYSSNTAYGSGSGPIWYRTISCEGNEQSIFDCGLSSDTSFCDHSNDIAVICKEKECELGAVQLVDGDSQNEGRIEVCEGGVWGTVCDDTWDNNDAIVMCRQLGYNSTYAQPFHFDHFSGATVPIAIDSIFCQGNELTWSECPYSTTFTFFCTHAEDAGLRCFNDLPTDSCKTGEVRLRNGTEYEGRVEVCVAGEWSSVCGDSWGAREAAVACNSTYGTTGVALPYKDSYFGNGTGIIQVTQMQCTGNEKSLLECPHSASPRDCDHSNDAGIRCIMGDQCNDTGAIQLTGGSSSDEGRVEICYNGVWGTITSSAWSASEAVVICGQLGYSSFIADAFTGTKYGPGTGVIHITYVSCSGRTTDIQDCDSVFYNGRTSDHSQDVGVKCYSSFVSAYNCTLGEVRLADGVTDLEGRVEICLRSGWGTVSSSYWTNTEARIACYQAGFGGLGASVITPVPGKGTVHITEIYCFGSESSLLTCQYSSEGNSSHVNDVGVRCLPRDNCTEGEIRLVDGLNEFQGIVEVCILSTWSTISDAYVGGAESTTICRQLGYTGTSSYYLRGQSTSTDRPIGISFLLCRGSENRILDCYYQLDPIFFDPVHENDIGVICQPELTTSSPTVTPPTQVSSSTVFTYSTPSTSVKSFSQTSSSGDQVSSPVSTVQRSTTMRLTRTSTSSPPPSETPIPINARESTVSVTIRGDFDSSNFPRDTFQQAVAKSANQYCEGRECRKRRSMDTRQSNNQYTTDDVVIVSVTDAEGGGVVVVFYVMDRGNNAVITADVLYEAVKRGINEGVFEEAGFTDMTIQPVSAPTSKNKSDEMSSASKVGISLAVIIIAIIIAVMVIVIIIFWMKRKSRRYELDKEHILASSGSFSQRSSMVEIDTKPVENEYVTSKQPVEVNEKLEFKKLEEETDEPNDNENPSSSTAF